LTSSSPRNPRTLAAYQADLEDFRRFIDDRFIRAPTVGKAVEWLLDVRGLANAFAITYRSQMIERRLQPATINRRLATLRSLVKLANTFGLVLWTLSVENAPVQPYRDTHGPGRDGFRAMLDVARAQPGPKGLRDVALLRLLHDLGLRRYLAITTALDRTDGDVRAVAEFSRHKDLRPLGRYRDSRHGLAGKVSRLVAEE
jgi:integrase/recombinase XerC